MTELLSLTAMAAFFAGVGVVTVNSAAVGAAAGRAADHREGGLHQFGDGGNRQQQQSRDSNNGRPAYRKTDYGALIVDSKNYRESIDRFKFIVMLFCKTISPTVWPRIILFFFENLTQM